MQNLPIVTALPTSSTQAPASTDNNSNVQAAEPFGNVLARQVSNSDTPQDSKKTDGKRSTSSAANDASTSTDNTQPAQAPTQDVAALSGSMLAVLMPVPVVLAGSAPTTKDTASQSVSTSSEGSNLPSDMLAMMIPATSGANLTATNGKGVKGSVIGGESNLSKTMATTSFGTTLQSAENKTVSDVSGVAGIAGVTGVAGVTGAVAATGLTGVAGVAAATGLTGVAGIAGVTGVAGVAGIAGVTGAVAATGLTGVAGVAAATGLTGVAGVAAATKVAGTTGVAGVEGEISANSVNTSKENTFTTALQTLSRDGTSSTQLDSLATKIQSQQIAPNAADGSLQNVTAPIVTNQSGAVQSAQAVINTPVTDPAWGNEFNQKITWMATQHQQTAELHLNPPNLGPLDVVLKVSGDQATALFTSPHAAVRDVVQQALPQLRDMLAGNGITLGNAMVSDQSPKDQQAWQASQQQKGTRGSGTLDATIASGSISAVTTATLAPRHQGMVDTFA